MVTENSLVEDDYEDYSDDLDFNIKKEFWNGISYLFVIVFISSTTYHVWLYEIQ